MRRRWVRAGLVGVVAWCSSALAQAQCTVDVECKGDRICEDGSCTPPPAPPPPATPAPAPSAAATPPAQTTVPAPTAARSLPPAQPTRPAAPPPLVRRSRAMMAGGIIMATTGSLLMLLALIAHSEERCPSAEVGSDVVVRCRHETPLSTYTLAITGVVLTGFGVPMLVHGAKRVPANASERARVRLALVRAQRGRFALAARPVRSAKSVRRARREGSA